MLEHFDRHFRAAIEKARARADRIIVVRQPWFDRLRSAEEAAQMWHGGVGQIWKGEVTTFYSHDVLSRLMAGVDARASVIASELGAEQLDVMPVFERSVRTFYDFCHLTPAGSRILAAAVAAAIVRQPLSLGAFGAAVPPELEHELTEKVS